MNPELGPTPVWSLNAQIQLLASAYSRSLDLLGSGFALNSGDRERIAAGALRIYLEADLQSAKTSGFSERQRPSIRKGLILAFLRRKDQDETYHLATRLFLFRLLGLSGYSSGYPSGYFPGLGASETYIRRVSNVAAIRFSDSVKYLLDCRKNLDRLNPDPASASASASGN